MYLTLRRVFGIILLISVCFGLVTAHGGHHHKYHRESNCPARGHCAFFDGILDKISQKDLTAKEAFAQLKDHGCKALVDFDIKNSKRFTKLLDQCPQLLFQEAAAASTDSHTASASSYSLQNLIGGMFPQDNPALSSILATFYVSLFPNLVLFAVPSSIPPRALRLLVSFAVGGLLGDVFLHLIPHIFNDSHDHGHGHSASKVSANVRNAVNGAAIFVGLLTFFFVDRIMRIFGAGHSHSHSHEPAKTHKKKNKSPKRDSGKDQEKSSSPTTLRRRTNAKLPSDSDSDNEADDEKFGHSSDSSEDSVNSHGHSHSSSEDKKPIKLSAYLNLIADATHNFTDGLAVSASFYISPAAGLSTFVAIFFHEIPHELGDFAILVQSGFSRSSALASQFFTALGAMAGTIAGILIEESSLGRTLQPANLLSLSKPWFVEASAQNTSATSSGFTNYIFALFFPLFAIFPSTVFGVAWSDLVIPFTAGGFMYIGSASVIPELLEPSYLGEPTPHFEDQKKKALWSELGQMGLEILSMLLGLGLMVIIALTE